MILVENVDYRWRFTKNATFAWNPLSLFATNAISIPNYKSTQNASLKFH